MTIVDYVEVAIAIVIMIPLLREAFGRKGG